MREASFLSTRGDDEGNSHSYEPFLVPCGFDLGVAGYFKAIKRCHFAAVGDKAKPEPVQAWIDWNNKLTGWVVTEILMCNCELMRVDVVVHFIDIARVCGESRHDVRFVRL